MFGELAGRGRDPRRGYSGQDWLTCLPADFKAFAATHACTDEQRSLLGVPGAIWTDAATVEGGVPCHSAVPTGAERIVGSLHQDKEEAGQRRATKRYNGRKNTEISKNNGAR